MNKKYLIATLIILSLLGIFLFIRFKNRYFSLNSNLPATKNLAECQKVRSITEETAYSVDKVLCEKCGGNWGLGADNSGCNPKTSDSNKTCTDNTQCEGLCLAEDKNATVGKCSTYKIVFGCNIEIIKGQAQSELCRD